MFVGCTVQHQQKPNHKQKPEKPLRLLWSFSHAGQSTSVNVAKPSLINKRVIITPGSKATALNQKTGKVLWQVQNPDGTPMTNFKKLYDSQTFYIKGDKGITLTAVNINNGSIQWEYTLKKGKFMTLGSDAMGPHSIYVSGLGDNLYKFSKDGILQYHKRTDHSPGFISFYKGKLYIFQAWKHNGYKNAHGSVLCLNPATLDTLWIYQTHHGGYYYAAPIFKNGMIYAGVILGPGEVAALNAKTGNVRWKTIGYPAYSMVLANDTLYVVSDQYLVALNAKNGHKLWVHNFTYSGASNLAYWNGYIYHAHGQGLYIFNAKMGKIAAGPIYAPDGDAFYNVSAGNGRIYIETSFHLYCYKAYSGSGG